MWVSTFLLSLLENWITSRRVVDNVSVSGGGRGGRGRRGPGQEEQEVNTETMD